MSKQYPRGIIRQDSPERPAGARLAAIGGSVSLQLLKRWRGERTVAEIDDLVPHLGRRQALDA